MKSANATARAERAALLSRARTAAAGGRLHPDVVGPTFRGLLDMLDAEQEIRRKLVAILGEIVDDMAGAADGDTSLMRDARELMRWKP